MYSTQKTSDIKKRSVRQGDPVDAEELIRRLNAYLEEQNAKASRTWDLRIRRSWGRSSQEKYNHESPTSGGTNTTTMNRNSPHVMHLFSHPLLRYQRYSENKTKKSKKNTNNWKSSDSITQQSSLRQHRDQYQFRDLKTTQSHKEDSYENYYFHKSHIFHIHTILRRRSGRGWKSGQTSSESQETVTEDSRNSDDICRRETEKSIWLSHYNTRSSRNKSSQQRRKWDWSIVSQNRNISKDFSSDKVSLETSEISSSIPESKTKTRSGFVALFRRNTRT